VQLATLALLEQQAQSDKQAQRVLLVTLELLV
jgi:hypothetical protein